MPNAATTTYSGDKLTPAFAPDMAVMDAVPLVDATYVAGTVLGQVTEGGKYKAYSNSNNDGSETARALLAYGCVVSGGSVTVGDEASSRSTAPIYRAGYFNCADLTGLDASAVAELGRLAEGDASTGVLAMF